MNRQSISYLIITVKILCIYITKQKENLAAKHLMKQKAPKYLLLNC